MARRGVLSRIAVLAAAARDCGTPAIHRTVAPEPADHIVRRVSGVTSFHGTALDTLLRGLGTQTVILTGVSTDVALPGTTIEATNCGYSVILPEDCTAGRTPETSEFTIREFFRDCPPLPAG